MDLLTPLIWVAFFLLFLVAIRRYLLHRSAVDRGVMLVFSSTAALFALSAINALVPAASGILSPVLVTLLIAQPALMLSLVSLVVRLPRWVAPAAWVGWAVVVVTYYATSRSIPALLLLVGYFGLIEVVAAGLLIADGRRRHGLPRARLALAGIGSLLFGLSIVLVGVSSAVRGGAGSDPNVAVAARLVALLAGISYLAAFAPPRWVLRLAHRALAFDLIRSIVASPSGSQPRLLWQSLATTVAQILGSPRVQVLDEERVLVEGPVEVASEAMSGADVGGRAAPDPAADVVIPLLLDGRRVATVRASLDNRALFLEDDIALIQTLGSLAARAVEREEAITRLSEANRAVADADAVRASEARFRVLLDASPNAILAVDEGGTIRWATRSAGLMFRSSADELIGHVIEELIPNHLIATDSRGGETESIRFEAPARRIDGESFPAEIAVSHFEYDGEPYRLVVLSDVTWRHEANAVRERFIGVLSHELRTPITSIFGGTQVLLSRARQLDAETQAELLTDIAGEAERLQRMIENLLVLARVEGGAEVAEAAPVLLHRVLPEVVAREQSMWPSLRIATDLPPSLPVVAGDEASLSLVLRNLISNAGKYAGAEASVRIVVTAEPAGEVCVRVLDDGPGVDPDEAERLFDLYFRSKGTHAMPGSGIGLFVCRQLVTAMGGRTWARPGSEGGAEFGFTLPVYQEIDAVPGPEAADRPPRNQAFATLVEP